MTNTLGMIVLLSITAFCPFIAKKANPTKGKNVSPNPTPNPIANPFLFSPSSLILPSNVIFCPSVA